MRLAAVSGSALRAGLAHHARALGTTRHISNEKQGFLDSLIHGDSDAKASLYPDMRPEGHTEVYEIRRVMVPPKYADAYRAVVANKRLEMNTKLAEHYHDVLESAGSWEVVIGNVGNFCYDKVEQGSVTDPVQQEFREKVAPYVTGRRNWITQAFTFWNSINKLHNQDKLFELRTYNLKPGKLLMWEREWRQGLDARRPFAEPVGAWFSHIGALHTVFHMWEFDSLAQRETTRADAWQLETWRKTVDRTVPMINSMNSQIMRPLSRPN
ncbi:hypothetical protein MVES1_002264 [Malassezia vespertilionis]|uniref:uncharacterized protein n=1 Tax=Malassezia vespertilionis TaxID=2020962 RepID=UPI0024B08182|nr:uncharacterized protein MVES1_002264 [Malassezia vespertilionis]WFD06909.1 hypothetical protein MVES1_002264 [Malassezia vespertilionis]